MRFDKPTAHYSSAIICPDCDYEVTGDSPRWVGQRPRSQPLVKLRVDIDAEGARIMECAQITAAEVATWPSWKLGRCNCPVVQPDSDFARSG